MENQNKKLEDIALDADLASSAQLDRESGDTRYLAEIARREFTRSRFLNSLERALDPHDLRDKAFIFSTEFIHYARKAGFTDEELDIRFPQIRDAYQEVAITRIREEEIDMGLKDLDNVRLFTLCELNSYDGLPVSMDEDDAVTDVNSLDMLFKAGFKHRGKYENEALYKKIRFKSRMDYLFRNNPSKKVTIRVDSSSGKATYFSEAQVTESDFLSEAEGLGISERALDKDVPEIRAFYTSRLRVAQERLKIPYSISNLESLALRDLVKIWNRRTRIIDEVLEIEKIGIHSYLRNVNPYSDGGRNYSQVPITGRKGKAVIKVEEKKIDKDNISVNLTYENGEQFKL